MKLKFKGRLMKDNTEWEMSCDAIIDDYRVSQRAISVVVEVNGKHQASLKEHFKVEVAEEI